ncbi:hypothetical protein D104_01280 [Marinomonas profundimaris]|uniref:Uncharacterized protein n=1 Tax=Marinomonas profundimaris TaxID=1208321 RepID=W1RZI7_9GAMM|nr:hypothetical protein D104_01280 [Marinomonas profundimaris]
MPHFRPVCILLKRKGDRQRECCRGVVCILIPHVSTAKLFSLTFIAVAFIKDTVVHKDKDSFIDLNFYADVFLNKGQYVEVFFFNVFFTLHCG